MAFRFGREDQVLDFHPRPPKEHSKPTAREYILWPALWYRVVAPFPRERTLNVFQRAVLNLCRAGLVVAESVGEKLDIHPDLVRRIQAELRDRGCIDHYGNATGLGAKVIEEDEMLTQSAVVGHVFQDPWDGKLWPRFMERVNYCALDYSDDGFPNLMLGTKGKPVPRKAFMVLADVAHVSCPTPAEVISAVAAHRRKLRYNEGLADQDDETSDYEVAQSGTMLGRVSMIDEEPQPVYLMTYLYLPDAGTDWFACDPFGLGDSNAMRHRVEQVMQDMPRLFAVVDRLVRRRVLQGIEEQKRWNDEVRTMAELEVERRLTVAIRSHKSFTHIMGMEHARQEAQLLGSECPPWKFHAALRNCRIALESVFGEVASRHPLGEAWKRVYVPRTDPLSGITQVVQQQDKKWLEQLYRSAAVAAGFKEPLPEAFLSARPSHIRAVAQSGESWRLRPLVMATLLAAEFDMGHPIREAAQRNPELLSHVEAVATAGGEGGHAHARARAQADLERIVECTYGVIAALVGVDLSPPAEGGSDV